MRIPWMISGLAPFGENAEGLFLPSAQNVMEEN